MQSRAELEGQRLKWQKEYDKKFGPGKVKITLADVEEINRNLYNFFELLSDIEKRLAREGKSPLQYQEPSP